MMPVGFLFPPLNADLLRVYTQKRSQTFHPLLEQFPSVDENKRVPAAMGDERRCDDGLAEGGRRSKHTVVMSDESIERSGL